MARCRYPNETVQNTRAAEPTRRHFLGAASATVVAGWAQRALGALPAYDKPPDSFKPELLSSPDEVWSLLKSLNQHGLPRFTGNDAHRMCIDLLHSEMEEAGLHVTRDSYTFPRWEVRKWSLSATPMGGSRIDLPVTFYYPHSGQSGPQGVTGKLAYVGKITSDGSSKPDLTGDLKGKILFIEYEILPTNYNEWYRPYGVYPAGTTMPQKADGLGSYPHDGWSLKAYKATGAVGVIFGWTNVSEDQATGRCWPFGQALQDLPALLIGPKTGAKVRELAAHGATATVTVDGDVFPDSKTDSIVAILPGSSQYETVIVHTHTDGPNAIQENGGVGVVALAKYLSRIPQGSRRRTFVFSLITGHDNSAYLPGDQGSFIDRHPDIVKKAVSAITVEHLGCGEWRDDDAHLRYSPTGREELAYAMTHHEALAKLEIDALQETADRRVVVAEPLPKQRYLGIGGSFAATGMPTLGYFGAPSYLNIVAPDGCMSKLNRDHFHGQVVAFAKLLHRVDAAPASDLKWLPSAPRRSGGATTG